MAPKLIKLLMFKIALSTLPATPLFGTSKPTLHRYLDDHFADLLDSDLEVASALLVKYKEEDIFTHTHMHLYALQKAVFLKLGLNTEWEYIVKWSREIPNKGYTRAINIVEEDEGYEPFVDELCSLATSSS